MISQIPELLLFLPGIKVIALRNEFIKKYLPAKEGNIKTIDEIYIGKYLIVFAHCRSKFKIIISKYLLILRVAITV